MKLTPTCLRHFCVVSNYSCKSKMKRKKELIIVREAGLADQPQDFFTKSKRRNGDLPQ